VEVVRKKVLGMKEKEGEKLFSFFFIIFKFHQSFHVIVRKLA
jgi:hypothetical protein